MNDRHQGLYEAVLRADRPRESLRNLVQLFLDSGTLTADSALEELEELSDLLRREDRQNDDDVVLDVMDFLVAWCSPHARLRTGADDAHVVTLAPGTGATVITDAAAADQFREQYFPPTALDQPRVVVLNLIGYWVTPGYLEHLLVPLARGIRGNVYGPLTLVVRTHDPSTAHYIRMLADAERLPIYVSVTKSIYDATLPEPVGLSPVELETLNELIGLGGEATAVDFAEAAGIGVSAASNRLAGLADSHFIYRLSPPGQRADMYVDPRKLLRSHRAIAVQEHLTTTH